MMIVCSGECGQVGGDCEAVPREQDSQCQQLDVIPLSRTR